MTGMDLIWEARASLTKAKRDAQEAWNFYVQGEIDRQEEATGKLAHRGAARAQAATHLPDDMLRLLGIDRYGSRI